MPTNHDETLPQRYEREHQAYLKLCGSMTAEQVADLQLQLNNSLAREQALQALLTAADEKNDTLSTAYVSAGEREHLLRLRVADLEGLLQMFIENTDDKDVIELAQHALKPAEGGGDEQG